MIQELELLAPAGTLHTLKAVISAGADAVYFGGSQFGARAYAGNFNKEEVLEAIDYGHLHASKVIMAINTLFKEREIEEQLYEYLLPYYEHGLDAVIVQDYGVMQFVRNHFPKLPIHTSTQMTVTNVDGAKFLVEQGASRIVMAREMSFAEIEHIHKAVPVEIESFVHGALCYCYSGQCLFSSMLGGRSGNRGRCAQPCRLPYEVYGQDMVKINDKNHMYPLSPKDLCTIDEIPKLAKSGVYSFKIEGRMKSTEYAAGVVSIYRKYIDRFLNYGAEHNIVLEEDRQKLYDCGNRSGFTKGYYEQWNGPKMITFGKPSHEKSNERLFEQITKDYIQTECKEKIQGYMIVKKDLPVSLTVNWKNSKVTVTGNVPMTAEKQPITAEGLSKRLQKTGNTPFVFENLEIVVDEGLFLPMASLNELRRKALDELQQRFVASYRRITDSRKRDADTVFRENMSVSFEQPCISASIEQKEQLQPLLQNPLISVIYADSIAFQREELLSELSQMYKKTEQYQKKLYYILPAIFRKHTSDFYENLLPELKVDGFLVKSYDALAFLLSHNIPAEKIRIDHNLYTWSNWSRESFYKLGIEGDTIPLELNRKEIVKRKNTGSEMLIYGHLPLMTSVQCINKNLSVCDKTQKIRYLKDRYGILFPTKNHCMECYNVIYNSKALNLFSVMDELKDSNIYHYRLSFTIESVKEIKRVLDDFEQALKKKGKPYKTSNMENYTYGHYKRGVE